MVWEKGKSGNPGGRIKQDVQLTTLAKQHTELALKTLVGIAQDYKAPPAARVKASEVLLDRGYGKAHQSIEHSGEIGLTNNTQDDLAVLTRYGVDLTKIKPEETIQ